MLRVPIAMMQKNSFFLTTFSAYTKMTAEKGGQDEVFARIITLDVNVVNSRNLKTFPRFG